MSNNVQYIGVQDNIQAVGGVPKDTTFKTTEEGGVHTQHVIAHIQNGDGTDVSTKTVGTQLSSTDQALVTNSIIHGLSSAGGGTYVDVKVNPSGSLQVAPESGVLLDYSTPINSSDTYTSSTFDVYVYPSVVVACKTDQAGTLYMEFSPDGTNWDSSLSFTVSAGINEVHRLSVTRRYFRIRFTNTSASNQTYLRLQSLGGTQNLLTSTLNGTIQSDADAIITRSVLVGQTDGGVYVNVPVTAEGHIEAAVHSPRLPFGSINAESLTPVVQSDFVYGINATEHRTTTGLSIGSGSNSASVTAANSLLTCATGTTQYSFGTLQSRKRVRYRAGQGIVGRFTALFSTPAANSTLVAGLGTAEAGVYFGYNGTSFGILHSTGGVREIQTMTITTASTATNNYVVTLPDGTTSSVTATNNASTVKTAYEISRGTYTGWTATQRGSTVVFLANSVGNKSGTFSLAQTGAVTPAAATVAETLVGVAATDTWIPQSSWNGDVMDGTASASNPSGILLDPSKGNVYQIGIQYLGFGAITFQIEAVSAGNNADFINVHTLIMPNARTSVSLSNPSFPFTFAAYSAGSTTNVSVSCASFAGMVEGEKRTTGPRQSYDRDTSAFVGSTASTYYPLFTVRNEETYATRANQAVVNLLSMGCSHDDATPVIFYLIRNATLVGTPNFTQYATNSCTYWDTAATTCTIADRSQIVFSYQSSPSGGSGAFAFSDEITIQPGETITLAARALTGTAPYVNASLNTREDI